MYKVLISLILLFSINLNAISWSIKFSGFGEVFQKLTLTDNSTAALYKNKGTWEDSLGNFGVRSCIGLVELNPDNKLIVGRFFCEASDNENNKYIFKGVRGDNKMESGLGKMTLIDGSGKWKKMIGATCTYAISYQKDAIFQVDKCKK